MGLREEIPDVPGVTRELENVLLVGMIRSLVRSKTYYCSSTVHTRQETKTKEGSTAIHRLIFLARWG